MTDYRSLITDYCFVPQKLYRYIFWLGYFTVLITSVIPIVGNLDKIRFGYGVFKIRLDHLLHVAAYILICMYYFIGLVKGLALFNSDSPRKFILLTLLLGTVTEIVQLWVPARAFNVMDWVANVSGILLGVVVIFGTKNRRKRGREKAGER